MAFVNEHAARIRDPREFVNFRREKSLFADGVDVIWGITEKGKPSIQSIRFDRNKWAEEEARVWIDAHMGDCMNFDPAAAKKKPLQAKADLMAMPGFLQICGADSGGVKFLAADKHEDGKKKLPKFSMIGYSGGAMAPRGFGRIVIDLQGMDIGGGRAMPVLKNHDSEQIVGHSEKIEAGNELALGGVISGAGAAAQEVIATSENGFPWQASVGADIRFEKIEHLDEGEKATINGQKQVGPVSIARESTLKEVSFVPIGADSETSARVGENN